MKLNIQLFAEGTFNGSSTTSNGKIRVVWNSTSSDAVANKSSVYAKVQVARTFTGDATRGTFSGTITINGSATSVSKKITMSNKDWYTIGETTIDVPHNEDGTKVCNISARLTQSGTSLAGTYTASADVQLDTIARASVFNSFSMSVNTNNSISVVASITKRNTSFTDTLNICNENITLNNGTNYITFSSSSHTTAYNRFYQLMGNQTQQNYTAVLTTSSSGTQIGNTSAITAYNVALPNYAISVGTITSSDNNANVYIRSGSSHKVSDFTGTNTFLQGWSNPRLSYSLGATYNTLYGNLINISGATTKNGMGLGSDSFALGTNFTGGTKTINATDGRKSASNSITLTRKDWATPTVSITLTRESATGTQVNWSVFWTYTNVSGGIISKLNASYTYNGATTTLISNRSLTQTSGSLSGSFQLANADDYKYSISANANLTDMIDYYVVSNIQIPGGLPAIYTHKDSSSNNLVDIYGETIIKGPLTVTTNGIYNQLENSFGFAHYSTNGGAGHWFNKDVKVQGDVYAGSSYNRQLAYKDETMPKTTYTSDFNNYIDNSFGSINGISNHKPTNDAYGVYGTMIVQRLGQMDYCSQIATDVNTGLAYTRYKLNGTWKDWVGLNHTRKLTFANEWRMAFNPYGAGWRMNIPFNSPYGTRPTLSLTSCEYFGTAGWKSCSASINYQTETECGLQFSGITDSETRSYMVLIRMTGTLTL